MRKKTAPRLPERQYQCGPQAGWGIPCEVGVITLGGMADKKPPHSFPWGGLGVLRGQRVAHPTWLHG